MISLIQKFLIRNLIFNDFPSIRNILFQNWSDTYYFILKKDLKIHLEKFPANLELVKLLNDQSSFCYSVESDDKIVACMKLFKNKIDKKFFISSLYVLPEFQGHHIG